MADILVARAALKREYAGRRRRLKIACVLVVATAIAVVLATDAGRSLALHILDVAVRDLDRPGKTITILLVAAAYAVVLGAARRG